jgi:hypothetical protein
MRYLIRKVQDGRVVKARLTADKNMIPMTENEAYELAAQDNTTVHAICGGLEYPVVVRQHPIYDLIHLEVQA